MASDLQLRLAEHIARLDRATPEQRRAIYEAARTTLNADIRAGAPFVSVQDALKRRRELETAIIAVEREAARNDPPPEPKKFERRVEREAVTESEPTPPVRPRAALASGASSQRGDSMIAAPDTRPEPDSSARQSGDPEQQVQADLDSSSGVTGGSHGNERNIDAISSEQAPEPKDRNERSASAELESAPVSVPVLEAPPEASSYAVVEQIDLDLDGETLERAPQRSALRSLTLYAAVALLVVGIVAAAAVIAGLGIDEIRGAASPQRQAPPPELRLRTGPAGMSPSMNPAAELFKSAGFNTAAAGALKEGNALLARGDLDRAIAAFDDAIRLDPREPAAYGNRAFAYWRKGEVERAIGDYGEAIALDAGNSANRLNRAIAYNRIGEYERAIADLDRVIVATPGNIEALNSRCWARAILKHLEEALADCNEANRLQPNDANILDSRGFVHLRLGLLDRSIADYNAALKVDLKLASSLYGRGLAKIGRGDRAGGAEDVAAARTIDPGIQDTFARYGIR